MVIILDDFAHCVWFANCQREVTRRMRPGGGLAFPSIARVANLFPARAFDQNDYVPATLRKNLPRGVLLHPILKKI
jgi:hypothetical protein